MVGLYAYFRASKWVGFAERQEVPLAFPVRSIRYAVEVLHLMPPRLLNLLRIVTEPLLVVTGSLAAGWLIGTAQHYIALAP